MAGPAVAAASPARVAALRVLQRVFEQGAYADRAFAGEARSLGARDRALAMSLAYGAVQRRATLDHVAAGFSSRPLAQVHPLALAALRLGLQQLLFMDGIAEHAAVHESVELTKPAGRGAAGFVNAVLRRAVREGRATVDALPEGTPAEAALRYSVPGWLAELWWEELGAGMARRLLAAVNRPAESALRVNTLRASAEEVAGRLPVEVRPATGIPEGLVLEGPFDIEGSELWRDGLVMGQSRGSMLAGAALNPAAGDRVLDLCAAPGAKTTQLAARMRGEGELVAVERHRGRARSLEATIARMGAGCARVLVADATELPEQGAFGAVLVDPPCSGLGTLQSRPDLRWRASPARIAELVPVQTAVLRAGARATAPGGALVYSVCTISRAEGPQQVAGFLDEHPGWRLEDLAAAAAVTGLGAPGLTPWDGLPGTVQTLPDQDGTDGFFIARLRRDG